MDDRNSGRKYNGWANYETWAVNLWLGNEEWSSRYWEEQTRSFSRDERAAFRLADQIEEEVTEAAPDLGCTLYADLLSAALCEVDWAEIAGNWLEEWTPEDDSCDGSGMPSTNPEGQPEEQPQGADREAGPAPFGDRGEPVVTNRLPDDD